MAEVLIAPGAERSDDAGGRRGWRSRVERALPAIGVFASGTVEYTIAKTWYDYFHQYVFLLAPRPFCDAEVTCDHRDGSGYEFLLTLGLFVVGALVNVISRASCLAWVPSIATLAGMTAMLTGFSLGDAILELRVDMYNLLGLVCGPETGGDAYSDCTGLDLLVGMGATLVVAALVACTLPLTRKIECGDGPMIDTLEAWAETVFRLVAKGSATALMTLWTAVLTKWSSFGVDRPNLYAHDAAAHSTGPEVETLLKSRAQYIQLQQVDLRHTHLFWAATTTWAGSLLSVGIAKAQAAYVAPRKAHPGGATLSMPEQTLSELLRLMQTTLGWVAGCAWTDVATDLWPPTYWDPDPDAHGWKVLLLNALWATVLTACAAAYLVLTQTSASEVWGAETTDRDDVERSFITGAFSFFVGWQVTPPPPPRHHRRDTTGATPHRVGRTRRQCTAHAPPVRRRHGTRPVLAHHSGTWPHPAHHPACARRTIVPHPCLRVGCGTALHCASALPLTCGRGTG
jgi:hypothetical protein